MHVISNKALRQFAERYPDADMPLQAWRRLMEKSEFENFAELKAAFGTVDKVGELYVIDIGGNKYRLIADVRLSRRLVFIKAVLPHSEYDKGKWK